MTPPGGSSPFLSATADCRYERSDSGGKTARSGRTERRQCAPERKSRMVFRKDGGEGGTNYCIELSSNPLKIGVDTLDRNTPNIKARSKPREGEELDLRIKARISSISKPQECISWCTESCISHQPRQTWYPSVWQHFRTCGKTKLDL